MIRCARCGRVTRNPELFGSYYYGPTCAARLRDKRVKVSDAEYHDRQLGIFTDAESADDLRKLALDELTQLSQDSGMYDGTV